MVDVTHRSRERGTRDAPFARNSLKDTLVRGALLSATFHAADTARDTCFSSISRSPSLVSRSNLALKRVTKRDPPGRSDGQLRVPRDTERVLRITRITFFTFCVSPLEDFSIGAEAIGVENTIIGFKKKREREIMLLYIIKKNILRCIFHKIYILQQHYHVGEDVTRYNCKARHALCFL